MKKKGIQLNEAFSSVLILVLVAVLVIIALTIFTSISTPMYAAGTAATSINETLGPAVTAGVTLTTGANARSGSCGAVTYILNGTTGVVQIGLGNITQTGCTVYNATDWADLGVVSARYTYPYTYSADTASTNATGTMITQFASYPTLVGLVGTVIFLGIIIGVLVASFAFGRKGV